MEKLQAITSFINVLNEIEGTKKKLVLSQDYNLAIILRDVELLINKKLTSDEIKKDYPMLNDIK